ncbi:sensor histidine kinase [Paenibacillus nasutitermitis]|uniref:histidine kinase n=1 Tax=Paenibacillus nasutitermitis TaxID=1652958 RepID=A0A917DTZ9_9BACL|nr:sensor histidine kinase [Paenibacillus nasutitermitis]GGD66560.1 sensor histidine kinase YesM [Paenibacillus nasutitermitis]
MRYWNDMLLKTKMFVAFSVVFLLTVLLACTILYVKNVNDTKDQTYALSSTITKQFSRTVELYIHEMEAMSVTIFGDPLVQRNLLDHYETDNAVEQNQIELSLSSRLYTLIHPQPKVQSIYLFTLDKYAYYVSRSSGPKLTDSLEGEAWYTGKAYDYRSKFLLLPTALEDVSHADSPKVISFVRSINRIPSRTPIAFMKININVNVFEDMLVQSDNNEMEKNMRVFILSDEGRVVYDNRHELTAGTLPALSMPMLKKGKSSELTWNGAKYLYSSERSAYTGWNTVVLIPNEYLLAQIKRTQLILILVGLAAVLLIAVVSYILSHHITIPLHNLMKKMNRVEQGDFSQRMEVKGNNEIGRLSRIYNDMLGSISRLINEAYQSRLAEKDAQLSALQAQINPHFLYNTLNIMKSISRVKGIEEVAEMSESLAELFQYSMKNLQHPVALEDELEHIRCYMNIQKHRFFDRFELQSDIPEELLQASILKLTIQPLIENAIIHGLGKKKSGGVIGLRVRCTQGILLIEVTDNGRGIDGQKQQELRSQLRAPILSTGVDQETRGIGLQNIQQRIQLFYGEPYGIGLMSIPGEGTTVKLEIPYLLPADGKGRDTHEYISGGG